MKIVKIALCYILLWPLMATVLSTFAYIGTGTEFLWSLLSVAALWIKGGWIAFLVLVLVHPLLTWLVRVFMLGKGWIRADYDEYFKYISVFISVVTALVSLLILHPILFAPDETERRYADRPNWHETFPYFAIVLIPIPSIVVGYFVAHLITKDD